MSAAPAPRPMTSPPACSTPSGARSVERRAGDESGVQSCALPISTLSVPLPEAGMFLMVDVSRTGATAQDFAFGLLDAERVAVLPGDAFGPQIASYVRINLGAPDAELEETGRR